MLKIKDNSKFDEIVNKYDLDYDADSDYESGTHYAIYFKDGVYQLLQMHSIIYLTNID